METNENKPAATYRIEQALLQIEDDLAGIQILLNEIETIDDEIEQAPIIRRRLTELSKTVNEARNFADLMDDYYDPEDFQ